MNNKKLYIKPVLETVEVVTDSLMLTMSVSGEKTTSQAEILDGDAKAETFDLWADDEE